MVHHCPRCELRFPSEAELTEHLDLDHGAPRQEWERYRYPTGRRQAPLYADDTEDRAEHLPRFLVVGNQTLGSQALIDHIRGLAASGPCKVTVLVPATSAAEYPHGVLTGAGAGAGTAARPEDDEAGDAQARWRLRQAIETLRAAGVDAGGTIGPPDPFTAVQQMLQRESFDRVIVSTLPLGVSRWLGMDLPRWIERRLRVPVTTIVVEPGSSAGRGVT